MRGFTAIVSIVLALLLVFASAAGTQAAPKVPRVAMLCAPACRGSNMDAPGTSVATPVRFPPGRARLDTSPIPAVPGPAGVFRCRRMRRFGSMHQAGMIDELFGSLGNAVGLQIGRARDRLARNRADAPSERLESAKQTSRLERQDLILTREYVHSGAGGGGWSNLWGTIAADRCASFARKNSSFF
jgi:hypothetical protein